MSPFQTTAPVSAAPTTAITSLDGTATIPAIVLATALPNSSGPTTLPTAARMTAEPGRAARVITSVAMALAASCTPLVNAKARAIAMATTRPVFTLRYSRDDAQRGRACPVGASGDGPAHSSRSGSDPSAGQEWARLAFTQALTTGANVAGL